MKRRPLSKITLTILTLISQTHAEINCWLFESTFTSYRSNYVNTTAGNCNVCCSRIKLQVQAGWCMHYLCECGINDNVNTDCLDLRSIWLVCAELPSCLWSAGGSFGVHVVALVLMRLRYGACVLCEGFGLAAVIRELCFNNELLDADWKMWVKEFHCFLNMVKWQCHRFLAHVSCVTMFFDWMYITCQHFLTDFKFKIKKNT